MMILTIKCKQWPRKWDIQLRKGKVVLKQNKVLIEKLPDKEGKELLEQNKVLTKGFGGLMSQIKEDVVKYGLGEPNAIQIATNKNNTRLIDLSSTRPVSEADNLISAKANDILNNEKMDQGKAEVSGHYHSESRSMGMDAHNNFEYAGSRVQNYPIQSSTIENDSIYQEELSNGGVSQFSEVVNSSFKLKQVAQKANALNSKEINQEEAEVKEHYHSGNQSMGTHNSFEDGGNCVQNDLFTFMRSNPNLLLEFMDKFRDHFDIEQNNLDQSLSLSESYASWGTHWSLENSITENDSFSSYQEECPRGHVQKGVANSFGLDNVHAILSMAQQLSPDFSNNPFSMSCLSMQEQESLQASLESNSASIQQSLQLRNRPLYDVDKKVFNSIDYRMNTEFPEHERSEQGFLVLNKSLSNNSTYWLEKEVKSDWVFQSSEVIQPKTQSQDLNDKDAKFSNNNSALVSSFGQANIVPGQVIQSVIDKTTHNNSTEQSASQLEQVGFNKNPLENAFQISKGENRRFPDEIRNKKEDLMQAQQEIDNLKSKVLTQELLQEKELKKINTQLIESKNLANAYNYQLSEYKEEPERIEAQLKEKEQTQVGLESSIFQQRQEIADLTNQVAQLAQKEQELDDTKQDLATQTSETNIKNDIISDQQASINNLTKEKSQLENILKNTQEKFAEELKEIKDQLAKKEGELDVAKENISQLDEDLKQAKQLEGYLSSAKRDLTNKTGEVTQLTEENTKLKNELKLKKPENNDLKTKLQESESKSKRLGIQIENLLESKNELESQIQDLQKQLESKNEELNGKNEKFSGASTHSKRQGNYASVSFVLSGAFAVGASLTIPYLAICIILAVAALTFLAVGCYCSYKANTALSNVEVDNCVNPTVVEV